MCEGLYVWVLEFQSWERGKASDGVWKEELFRKGFVFHAEDIRNACIFTVYMTLYYVE